MSTPRPGSTPGRLRQSHLGVSSYLARLYVLAGGVLVLFVVVLIIRQRDSAPDVDPVVTVDPVPIQTPVEPEESDAPSPPEAVIELADEILNDTEAGGLPQLVQLDDVAQGITDADAALAEGRLIEPEAGSALQLYLSVLLVEPENEQALEGVDLVIAGLMKQAESALDEGKITAAANLIPVMERLRADDSVVMAIVDRVKQEQMLIDQLAAATLDLEAGRLVSSTGEDALSRYRSVLDVHPEDPAALEGLRRVESALLARARQAAVQLNFNDAERWLEEAEAVRGGSGMVVAGRNEVESFRMRRIEAAAIEARASMLAQSFVRASADIDRVAALGASPEFLSDLRKELQMSRLYGRFVPGERFDDLIVTANGQFKGPEMVVVPVGAVWMGSLPSEPERNSSEGPRHRVEFDRGFALARTELSVGQFRLFVQSARYETEAEQKGFSYIYVDRSGRTVKRRKITWRHDYEGRDAPDDYPVIHVSWNDAKAYVAWLSDVTGELYRLPTESEFEYALRGGSDTTYWWGDGAPVMQVTNATGGRDESRRNRVWQKSFDAYGDGYWGPAPPGTFLPNSFFLYDMAGNVSEWVEDCWHDNYVRSPMDGSAWVNRGCEFRVVRGGSWGSAPASFRSAARLATRPDQVGPQVGFRVARTLVYSR